MSVDTSNLPEATHFSDVFSPHKDYDSSSKATPSSLYGSPSSGSLSSGPPLLKGSEDEPRTSAVDSQPAPAAFVSPEEIRCRQALSKMIPDRQALKNLVLLISRHAYLYWPIALWIMAITMALSILNNYLPPTFAFQQHNATGMTRITNPSIENASFNFLQSMDDLRRRTTLEPVDLLKLRESSEMLQVQQAVQSPTETSNLIWELADAVETIFNMMRQLNGKGYTETSVFMREFLWLADWKDQAVETTKSIVEHHYDTITILSNLAASTDEVIRSTNKLSRNLMINLYQMERVLGQGLKSLRLFGPFAGASRRAVKDAQDLVKLILEHASRVATFLQDNRLMIKLYHDNAQSWLDTVARRIHAPRYANGQLFQCSILLDTLHIDMIDRQPQLTLEEDAGPRPIALV